MAAEVLVVNSPLFEDKIPDYNEDSLPPLGLGYIATGLQESGVKTDFHDSVAHNTPVTELVEQIEESSAEVVALNVFTTNLDLVRKVVEGVTREVRILVGGLSTKHLRKEIFSWETPNSIDVVYGDGERITPALVRHVETQDPVVEDGKTGARRYFVVDPGSAYYVDDISSLSLDRRFFVDEPMLHARTGFREANIIASRGCVYNCAFCAAATSQSKDTKVRIRPPEDLRAEVESLQAIYPGLDSVRVLDDLFMRNPRAMEGAAVVFEGTGLHWRAMAHVVPFRRASDDLISRLHDSGCHELFMGIESGSERVLKDINKNHDLGLIRATVERLLTAGISVKGFFIYGFPGETEEECQQTYDFASSLRELAEGGPGNFRTSVFRFRPYHGTALYDRLVQQGHELGAVKRDAKLADMDNRQQFNFQSQNFSACPEEVVVDFVRRTNALNHG